MYSEVVGATEFSNIFPTLALFIHVNNLQKV